MKNYLRTTVACALFVMAPVLSHAARWIEFSRSESGNVGSIDIESIVSRGSSYGAWMKVNFGTPKKSIYGIIYQSVLSYDLYNCQDKTSANLEIVTYAKKDQQAYLETYKDPSDFEPVIPNSGSESLLSIVCTLGSSQQKKFSPAPAPAQESSSAPKIVSFNGQLELDPECPEHFYKRPPETVNLRLENKARHFCFEGFAIMHSGLSHTPLWSAEHLTASRLEQVRKITRKNKFHVEERLPADERAELRDYAKSGFDLGLMAPSGDMPTETAQYESFSLANMIPKNPNNNEMLWERIEEATRNLTRERGELYVITGPIFEGATIRRLNSRVFIPTAIFKAIYDPARHEAAAYIAPNTAGTEYQTVSITELEKRINIKLFPETPSGTMMMVLPKPYKAKVQAM